MSCSYTVLRGTMGGAIGIDPPATCSVHRVWRQHCGDSALSSPSQLGIYNICRLAFFADDSSRISACRHDSFIAAPLSTVRVLKFKAIRFLQKNICRSVHCPMATLFYTQHAGKSIAETLQIAMPVRQFNFVTKCTLLYISVRDALMSHYCRHH